MGSLSSMALPGPQPAVLTRETARSKPSSDMSKEKDVRDVHDLHSYDARIVERNIKRGLISRKDYDKFIRSLPDAKDKVRPPDKEG